MTIELVAFDADDTLWHSENEFHRTQRRLEALLAPYCTPDEMHRHLMAVERRNLDAYGYGVKAFTLSVLETALELSHDQLSAAEVRAVLDAGKELLAHPVELLPGAVESIAWAAERWPVVVVTKGDLFHQESKVARAGLGDLLAGVEVVSEKDEATFSRVWRRHRVEADKVVMVGNSLRSDIAPVLELGGWGVHVPYAVEWELDRHHDEDSVRSRDRYRTVPTLEHLPDVLSPWR